MRARYPCEMDPSESGSFEIIKTQTSLLLELMNLMQSTIANLDALTELVIDMRADQTGDRQQILDVLAKRQSELFEQVKTQSIANVNETGHSFLKAIRDEEQ